MTNYTINWLVEGHVITSNVYQIDASALVDLMTDTHNLVNQSDRPLVHVIWDLTELSSYPTNLTVIRDAVRPLFENPRLGWALTVINHPMVNFLAQVGTSMYQIRHRSSKSYDEAINFLLERDSTLSIPM